MTSLLRATVVAMLALASTAVDADAQGVLPFPHSVKDYDNGLRLVTMATEYPGLVSIQIVVGTGSRNEIEEGKSGFAHFFEHMMFRGSKNYSSAEQAAVFKAAGADRNAYTTDDYTNYHTTVAAEELETVLKMEADRFRYLEYPQEMFRTEAMAVLGEYNKSSSDPVSKLLEVLRDTAFESHTYKHTTMGFLRDIRAMPRQYEYSLEFFDRWYKPEHVTILVVGDIDEARTQDLVDRYWGDWQRGTYRAEIPTEPAQQGPLTCHVSWPVPTQPWVVVAFKGPAFDPDAADMPTLDVLSQLAFSSSSELYQRLYVQERKVDVLAASFPDAKDPYLLSVFARVRNPEDWAYVRDQILATCEEFKTRPIDESQLAAVRSNLLYSFVGSLDSSEAIADAMAGYIGRTRDPESIEKVYRRYREVQADEVRAMARRYFREDSKTVATLSHEPLPEIDSASVAADDVTEGAVLMPSTSPLVSLRLLYDCGAADDPEGKRGLCWITTQMLSNAATEERSYEDILAALYPMAASVQASVDKEMTVLSGTVHGDNLESYYRLLREMLTRPAFRQEDLDRILADTQAAIDVGLRRSDDEELGKEVLYEALYAGHPYGHLSQGALGDLESITLADVRGFYDRHIRKGGGLTIGLAGGFPEDLPGRIRRDLGGAAVGEGARELPVPAPIERNRMTIVEKNALATGMHIGFPIEVTRSHPDWVALWLVRSYFGEHRSENSYLYQRLREIRGLNYGDYAYIEYFPRGGQQFHPDPNLARQSQIFQIWIRPVPHANAPFTLKAAYYELEKLVREGMDEAAFESTRSYLSKFVHLLVKSQDRQLGYAMDSEWYGTESFADSVRDGLEKLTVAEVNRVLREHLRAERLQFVVVTEDGAAFRDAILSADATPIRYQAKPGPEILAEDAVIEGLQIPLRAEDIKVLPVEEIFR